MDILDDQGRSERNTLLKWMRDLVTLPHPEMVKEIEGRIDRLDRANKAADGGRSATAQKR